MVDALKKKQTILRLGTFHLVHAENFFPGLFRPVQNCPAFQEFFDQWFGRLDTTPLTKKPKVSENHTLPYTFPQNKPPHPQENSCPDLRLTQEPVQKLKQTKKD